MQKSVHGQPEWVEVCTWNLCVKCVFCGTAFTLSFGFGLCDGYQNPDSGWTKWPTKKEKIRYSQIRMFISESLFYFLCIKNLGLDLDPALDRIQIQPKAGFGFG